MATWCKRAIEEGLIDTKRAIQLGIRGIAVWIGGPRRPRGRSGFI